MSFKDLDIEKLFTLVNDHFTVIAHIELVLVVLVMSYIIILALKNKG